MKALTVSLLPQKTTFFFQTHPHNITINFGQAHQVVHIALFVDFMDGGVGQAQFDDGAVILYESRIRRAAAGG
jgi:hypothetical protein